MGLSTEQKVIIRTFFESNYNLFFGAPTEREAGGLTPNEQIMVLQHLQLHLMQLPTEPLAEELLSKDMNGSTVRDLLTEFLEENHSPIKPESYNALVNFTNNNIHGDPATPEEITAHLVDVIGIVTQQMEHGYLKKESDPVIQNVPNNSNAANAQNQSYLPTLLKLGFFGGAILGVSYVASKVLSSNNSNSL
ncbi:hypothetical protein [Legionella waltersii]|uniref:Uncharacterized protein n=1 Tax=Legionella waltersii TaxID=66969 RepID=A0A0W1ABU2_9GAMM|nr:hypothetical protein [Legionella waltersii]KTD78818.1 hypothetical protein Lwal_1588 [Legionella waltersii]SNV10983.1 Uncharacterised protein [Legionella waltersii]